VSRKRLVVEAVVHAVETTSQLVHVSSMATASGITTNQQVVQMQVGTLRVTALPAPTRSREQAVGRGVVRADAEHGARRASGRATRAVWKLSRWSWHEHFAAVDKVWLSRYRGGVDGRASSGGGDWAVTACKRPRRQRS